MHHSLMTQRIDHAWPLPSALPDAWLGSTILTCFFPPPPPLGALQTSTALEQEEQLKSTTYEVYTRDPNVTHT